jgi:surfactin synthase thioesterase subunit
MLVLITHLIILFIDIYANIRLGGNGNYFRPLAKELETSGINVHAYSLPSKPPKGRVYSDVDDIVNQLHESILKVEDVKNMPCVFFGHSLGAIVAFELSRKLKSDLDLKALIVSAAKNPDLLSSLNRDPMSIKRYTLNDKDFIEYFRSIGGLPDGLDKDMLQLSSSWIRDDYKAFETYQIKEFSKVPCPLFAFGGLSDPSVQPVNLNGWFDYSHNELYDVENLPTLLEGSHFYLTEAVSKTFFKEKLISICTCHFELSIKQSIKEQLCIATPSYCVAKEDASAFLTEIDSITEEIVKVVIDSGRERENCYSFIKNKELQPV